MLKLGGLSFKITYRCRLIGLGIDDLNLQASRFTAVALLIPRDLAAQPRVISLRLIFSHMGHGHRHPRLGDFSRDIDAKQGERHYYCPTAVGLAVALPHRVGLVAVRHYPTTLQRLTSRRECPSCDTSPNFQAQTALEFAGAG